MRSWRETHFLRDTLSYDVYRSRYAWVLDKIWKTERDTAYYRDAEEIDPNPWDALEVRSNMGGIAVYARYEDALLFFYADTPPSEDQTELILEKLDLQEDAD